MDKTTPKDELTQYVDSNFEKYLEHVHNHDIIFKNSKSTLFLALYLINNLINKITYQLFLSNKIFIQHVFFRTF